MTVVCDAGAVLKRPSPEYPVFPAPSSALTLKWYRVAGDSPPTIMAWSVTTLVSAVLALPYAAVPPYSTWDWAALSVFHVTVTDVGNTFVTPISDTAGFAGEGTVYRIFSLGRREGVLCFSVANTHLS